MRRLIKTERHQRNNGRVPLKIFFWVNTLHTSCEIMDGRREKMRR